MGPLTDAAYRAWLRDNAIRYVALPDAPLDYSSVAERRLILSAPPYLHLRWHSPHWRVYSVSDPEPLVDPIGAATARTQWVGHQGFWMDVSHPGDFLVRVNFTPYWSISRGSGCLMRRGDWTLARADHPGVFRVSADFSLGRPGTPRPAPEKPADGGAPSEGKAKRENGSSKRLRTRERNSAPSAP